MNKIVNSCDFIAINIYVCKEINSYFIYYICKEIFNKSNT